MLDFVNQTTPEDRFMRVYGEPFKPYVGGSYLSNRSPYPWMGQLGVIDSSNKFHGFCGASLLNLGQLKDHLRLPPSTQVAVTAAQCVRPSIVPAMPYAVVFGRLSPDLADNREYDERDYGMITKILPNLAYGICPSKLLDDNLVQCNFYNDIALLLFNLSSSVTGVPVTRLNNTYNNVTSLGWGPMTPKWYGSLYSRLLHRADMYSLTSEDCQGVINNGAIIDKYTKRRVNRLNKIDQFICAIGDSRLVKGDGGGPLFLDRRNPELVGVLNAILTPYSDEQIFRGHQQLFLFLNLMEYWPWVIQTLSDYFSNSSDLSPTSPPTSPPLEPLPTPSPTNPPPPSFSTSFNSTLQATDPSKVNQTNENDGVLNKASVIGIAVGSSIILLVGLRYLILYLKHRKSFPNNEQNHIELI